MLLVYEKLSIKFSAAAHRKSTNQPRAVLILLLYSISELNKHFKPFDQNFNFLLRKFSLPLSCPQEKKELLQ